MKFYVIVLILIFNTTYKGEIEIGIYIRDLHHELVLFQQSRNCFRYVPENDIEEDILGWNPSKVVLNFEEKMINTLTKHSIYTHRPPETSSHAVL